MGAGHSAPSGAKVAFNVLKVHPNSPASQAGLIPYFDYILSVNGVTVEMPNVVAEMAKSHAGKTMHMHVYNSRNDTVREVTIMPRSGWGGDGLLGCSIRFTTYERAIDRVWRILDTAPDSPGFRAGLVPLKDWIIGSVDLALHSEDDFYQLLIQNKKRPVKLIVFNLDSNACREVVVVPDFDLGCDIGTGVLNRVPIDKEQVIANIAGNEKDSLLAGQGLLKDEYYEPERICKSPPGRPVVADSVEESKVVFNPVVEPELAVHETETPFEEAPFAPVVESPFAPIIDPVTSPSQSNTHPLFAEAPVGVEDLFK